MVTVGLIEAILIGVVYTEVFTCLAESLAQMANSRFYQQCVPALT